MTQIALGKLLPNIKISVGTDELESDSMNIKDDVISSDLAVEIVRPSMESLQTQKIYKNRFGGFATGIDLISQELSGVLDKRAERFGLDKDEVSHKPCISSLYESLGINIEDRHSARMKNVRLDTLHVRGVEELSTDEVFIYFKDYGPDSLEWINDCCCNVLWFDEASCARALLGLSKPLPSLMAKKLSEAIADPVSASKPDQSASDKLKFASESMSELDLATAFSGTQISKEGPDISSLELDGDKEIKEMEIDHVESKPSSLLPVINIPVPPGYWRLGVPHSKAKTILLRFATTVDKKLPGAENRSNFYKKHGNPNYGGLKGIISSSRKHKTQAAANRRVVEKGSSSFKSQNPSFSKLRSESSIPKNSIQKPLRMRMYADDEELRAKKSRSKNYFPEKKRSVHSRLGKKYTADDLCHLGSYRDDSLYESRNYVPRSSDLEFQRKRSPENQVDLRSKLKWIRSEIHVGETRKYARESHGNDYAKKYNRIDSLKQESRSYYKRKHRSPLCVDNDDSDNSSSDE